MESNNFTRFSFVCKTLKKTKKYRSSGNIKRGLIKRVTPYDIMVKSLLNVASLIHVVYCYYFTKSITM